MGAAPCGNSDQAAALALTYVIVTRLLDLGLTTD